MKDGSDYENWVPQITQAFQLMKLYLSSNQSLSHSLLLVVRLCWLEFWSILPFPLFTASDTGYLFKVGVMGTIFYKFPVSLMTDLWKYSWALTTNKWTGRTVSLGTLEGGLVKHGGVSLSGGSFAGPEMPRRQPFFIVHLGESISLLINLFLVCSRPLLEH